MKQILSYNSEYDDICVIKAVSEAEAPDAFRAYVKERAVELLEIADNEAEELMEDNCDMEYGLCYNKETHAASIFLANGESEILRLVDIPEVPISDRAYYEKQDEMRKADVLKVLLENACMSENEEIPEKKRAEWNRIAETAVPIFDRLSGFHCGWWDEYWSMIREAARQAEEQLTQCRYAIFQLKDEAEEYLFLPYKRLEKNGKTPSIKDYNCVYSGEVHGFEDRQVLEELFTQFNMAHPLDFSGHSLSVSDVVSIRRGDRIRFYYCDFVGYKELVGFTDKGKPLPEIL